MVRINFSPVRKAKHKKTIKAAKGYRGHRHNLYRAAKDAVEKAGLHSYDDRRRKKRDFRVLWITRISAAVRAQGLQYSRFINLLAQKKIIIDRKILADLALRKPEVFKKIVDVARG